MHEFFLFYKKKLVLKKHLEPEKYFGLVKCLWSVKSLGSISNLGPIEFWVCKNSGTGKNFKSKKIHWVQKFVGQTKCCVRKTFWILKICAP